MLDVIRTSSQSWWVRGIFILLIATFVFWGIGSALISNPTAVALVNGYSISQEQFLRRLQQEKQSILQENPQVTNAMLEEMGIRKQILNNLILRNLLLTQAQENGIIISDTTLRKSIMNLPLFKNKEGKFDSTLYSTMLKNNKSTMLLFENDLREDLMIQEFMKLIVGSSFISDKRAFDMYTFLNEERSVEYVFIPAIKYLNDVNITQQEKEEFYTKNQSIWAQPHRMSLQYIPLTATALRSMIDIPKSLITEYYDEHKATYKDIPVQEARTTIANLLKEQKIPSYREELIDRIQSLRMEGKSLQEIATLVNIPLQRVELLPLDDIEQSLTIQTGTLAKYTSLANNTMITDPLPLQGGNESIFASIIENSPPFTPQLSAIENDVEYALRSEKALAKAKEQAEKAKASFPANATRSQLFPRFTPPLELPVRSDDFIQDLFSTAKGNVLPNVYTTTQGAIIARVHDILPAQEAEWNTEKQSFIRQIENVQGELLFRAFQNYLFTEAKIEILNETLLQPQVTE